jgi:hypothetical protein
MKVTPLSTIAFGSDVFRPARAVTALVRRRAVVDMGKQHEREIRRFHSTVGYKPYATTAGIANKNAALQHRKIYDASVG